ncbi:hypothetical protein BGC07_18045 [Piscirickettsia litoralis]|uniref:Terminase large subunit GpA endonuclease domain-containing protein n=2 Tax=Piscirickettsia litoralis TaxID=1891921 RepID=A0ABX2ZX20_9GAMM|nr:hypothetical protein BGC07_18045 [Piscirickettsia litoralis]
MNKKGRFIAPSQTINKKGKVTGEPPQSTTASYFISGLMSPFVSWGERAEAYVQAIDSGDPKEIQGVVNLDFGEIYAEVGETPDHQVLLEKREPYDFRQLHEQVQIITAGVDVQGDRLYYSIRGWGAHYESWQLESGCLYGAGRGSTETQHQEVWDELTTVLQRDFDGLPIHRILVDSGWNPLDKSHRGKEQSIHKIYEYCRLFPSLVFPAKGYPTMVRSYSFTTFDEKKKSKAANARNLRLIKYNTDYMKTWLYARFNFDNGQRGAFHLSADENGPQDYCQQLASESRHISETGKVEWKKEGENHYLDCEVLNLTAALSLNIHKLQPVVKDAEQAPKKRRRTTYSRR